MNVKVEKDDDVIETDDSLFSVLRKLHSALKILTTKLLVLRVSSTEIHVGNQKTLERKDTEISTDSGESG